MPHPKPLITQAHPHLTERTWSRIIAACDHAPPAFLSAMPAAWRGLFAPLLQAREAPWLIGQLGQSLDGRIATPAGHSHYINGPLAIEHLHRVRALVDAVLIGVGTALADDPQLTVRHAAGRDPARIVIDPNGRLPAGAKLLRDDGCRRVIVTAADSETPKHTGVEVLRIARDHTGKLDPLAITHGLSALGFRRVLVEGGMTTVSAFLARNCLDRLHLAIAPLILGSGPVGLSLPAIERIEQGLHPATKVYPLGRDMLIDCDLRAPRTSISAASPKHQDGRPASRRGFR